MSASARIQDFEYLYASNTNVSNFVSVKLSGNNNYHVWKSQMLCLLDSNNMGGIVDATFVSPIYSSTDIMRRYNSLVRGWILGSVSKDVLADVHNLGSAKDVWEKLKSIYDTPCMREVDRDALSAETNIVEEGSDPIEIIVPAETTTKTKNGMKKLLHSKSEHYMKRSLHEAAVEGKWSEAESILKKYKDLVTVAIDDDGGTILHIAVGKCQNDSLKNMLLYINDDQHLLKQRNSDGSTALHIASIVGNKVAAELLVKKNEKLLEIKDHKGQDPLQKAYEYMHLDTIGYLLKAIDYVKKDAQSSLPCSFNPGDKFAVDFLVNAISAKQYSLALKFMRRLPKAALVSDDVLMAIAKTFPSGLHYWERVVHPPSWESILGTLFWMMLMTWIVLTGPVSTIQIFLKDGSLSINAIGNLLYKLVILTVPVWLALPFVLIALLIFAVFSIFYSLWWKGAKLLFTPIKRIENKQKDLDGAKEILELVCDEIDKNSGSDPCYTGPILEAARQNAYIVVKEILSRSPKAIKSMDKSGHDIIQIAILNRSEEIYSLIYDIGERKNLYRTCKDSYQNNILHLAGRLAPSRVLNQRTGAALQLQRELQWREEVKKFVFPTHMKQENIFKETPDMIFTKEHKDLVKEGEQWMKTTAESCSITAALITTIVFAAAITVPGGNNQEKGTPLFEKESAFIIFAISDAISLFTSSTALLVFLSILTARFAENDFLVSLPNRLFIGLFSLLVSATTMIIAFSATLFLVFCDKKLWMLGPIGGLAFIPIASFVTLQFPLMVDLFRSTYLPIFGVKQGDILQRTLDKLVVNLVLTVICTQCI